MDALDRARRALGEKHPTTSSLTAILAVGYWWLNQLEKAEVLALRAVELRRSTLGEDHPLTQSMVCVLATTYIMQQQFDKARPLTEAGACVSATASEVRYSPRDARLTSAHP